MIKKRPSYPIGYSFEGLPTIEKVLHADGQRELYKLVSIDDNNTSLLLVLSNSHACLLAQQRLIDWWAIQSSSVITHQHLINGEGQPKKAIYAVFELHGFCIEDVSFAEAKEARLRSLFSSLLDLVERGITIQMYPDFEPSFTWVSTDGGTICTLLPLVDLIPSQVSQVQHVTRAFFRFATGIELGEVVEKLPSLISWSKFSGEELSRIVERCLSPAISRSSITNLASLNSALARKQVEVADLSANAILPRKLAERTTSKTNKGLDRVAGMRELKQLLYRDVIDPLRNPEPYRQYGLSIPNGILLYGPPGCGKTYIARQLAEEMGHYFVEIIPSELASSFVHQSVIRIRELFESAAEQAPAIIFIDEFEALVPTRGELGGHQQYKAEEVNEFLAHLDSCSEKKIFVIAATNQPDKIDLAVRRTGRLDKLIYVGAPDLEARKEMISFHLEGRPVATDFSLVSLAEDLAYYSASDIHFLVDEAARDALRENKKITRDCFRSAMQRVQPSVLPEIEKQYRSIEQRGF